MYGQVGVEQRKVVIHQYTSSGRTYREIDRKAKHFSDGRADKGDENVIADKAGLTTVPLLLGIAISCYFSAFFYRTNLTEFSQ